MVTTTAMAAEKTGPRSSTTTPMPRLSARAGWTAESIMGD